MTLSAYAANSSPGPLAGVEYRPGACNIGHAEIARRRQAGHVGLPITGPASDAGFAVVALPSAP